MIGAVREVIEEAQRVDFGCHKAKPIVVLVTLDVKNMFNLVRWIDILRTLREEFKDLRDHSQNHKICADQTDAGYAKSMCRDDSARSLVSPSWANRQTRM